MSTPKHFIRKTAKKNRDRGRIRRMQGMLEGRGRLIRLAAVASGNEWRRAFSESRRWTAFSRPRPVLCYEALRAEVGLAEVASGNERRHAVGIPYCSLQ